MGPFNKDQMIAMDEIEAHAADGLQVLDSLLLPIDYALQDWPSIQIEKKLCRCFSQGQSVQIDSEHSQTRIRVYSCDNVFIGMGEVREKGELVPRRIFTSTALLN